MFYSKSTGGFYTTDIHGNNIPADAVEITSEQYSALLQAQSNGASIQVDANGFPVAVLPVVTLASAQAEKALEIRGVAAEQIESIAAPYLPQERESWDTQLKEADAYTANNAAPTPLLTSMATARGITVSILVAKVYENANLYRTAIGAILGKQQGLLDQVYVATTIEAVEAISFT